MSQLCFLIFSIQVLGKWINLRISCLYACSSFSVDIMVKRSFEMVDVTIFLHFFRTFLGSVLYGHLLRSLSSTLTLLNSCPSCLMLNLFVIPCVCGFLIWVQDTSCSSLLALIFSWCVKLPNLISYLSFPSGWGSWCQQRNGVRSSETV